MAKTPDTKEAGIQALKISSRPDEFYRAGRRWTREAQVVPLSEFTLQQVAALKLEGQLVVEEVVLPAADASSSSDTEE